ncbi:MAG: DNRLRE domain-containing protein, partial [Bacteroidales bacterium]|nr:DNRLRE domain-containing protein [Bacteroidales bacterium]
LITEPWEENSVTWNNQPMTTETDQLYLPPSNDPFQDYTDMDVTALIQKLYNEPDNYHGLMLKMINEYPYHCLLFASSDYSDTIEMRPKLEVTYTIAPEYTLEIQPGPEEGKDAQLWTIMPDNNYGDIPKFDCSGWTHYGVPGVNRGIIDFDLSAIPDNAEITDAKLNFYFVCLEPTYFGHTGENDAYLQLITEPWEEDSVTWNNQPLTTETDQLYLPPSTDPYMDYTDLEVTNLIRKLHAEPENYHGIMLRLLNESPYRCLLFASSDYMDTVEMRPKLVITYTLNSLLPIADFNYETEGLNVFFENTSTNAEEYWWDFGDGYYSDLKDPWHIYDEPGIYTVSLTVWNEYGYDTVMKIISVPSTASPEQSMAILKVYPNVAHDQITLSTNIIGKTDLVIVDSYGRPVINSTLEFSDGETHLINVSQLNPGFYFARISKGNQTDTRKLIISR